MADIFLSIAKDFSPSPAGRRSQDGPFNAERFRDQVLVPAIERAIGSQGRLIVDFADADSYSSSFLEEVFGGLVRGRRFAPNVLRNVLQLKSEDPVYDAYVLDAKEYLSKALAKAAA